MQTTSDRLGCCPGCALPAAVGEPCARPGCRAEGLHAIPAELWEDAEDSGEARHPLVGRLIDGYLVTGLLGEGGFGRVFRAVALADGEEVALKLTGAPGHALASMHAERLLREARALGRIQHGNVIRLVGNGVADGSPYLVLELLADHRSLADEIAERAEDDEGFVQGEIRDLLDQLLDGLEAAHDAGVVHRDVKPDNIMLGVGPDGGMRLKLIDFGLAKLRPSPKSGPDARRDKTPDPSRTQALGTPTHMAPEQLAGKGLGPWTDLYAVGVIAYELLTGHLPFEGDSAEALLRQRQDADHDALARAPELPAACRTMLERALAPDPRDRFQSVAEMRAAVDGALIGWPGPAPLTLARDVPDLVVDLAPARGLHDRLGSFGPALPALAALLLALVGLVATAGGDDALEEAAPRLIDDGAAATFGALAGTDAGLEVSLVPTPPPPPAPEPSALVRRALACQATPAEVRELAARCADELGCTPLTVGGDTVRGLTLSPPSGAERVVLALASPEAPNACGTKARRGRAIVAGAWDEIEPAWGGYVAPRVVLEARSGRSVAMRRVLLERGEATGAAALDDVTLCLAPGELPAGLALEAAEELRFQVADTRRFTGEEGRFPCRLDVVGAFVVSRPAPEESSAAQPKRPAM